MGKIASSTTVYSVAYLTEKGRQYLFDSPKNPRYKTLPDGTTYDLLAIESFSLGDPDVNYYLPLLPTSGSIPDLSGDSDMSVRGSKGRVLTNLISPVDVDFEDSDIQLLEYKSTQKTISFDLSLGLDKLKTVITQQLLSYIDGQLATDGIYDVYPTSYGKSALNGDKQLIIPILDPTLTTPGYRLRIFYPTIGDNYNKITFQIEIGVATQATLSTSVSQVISVKPLISTIPTI